MNEINPSCRLSSNDSLPEICEGKEANYSRTVENQEDETDNLFKLSVLFVRGNPFDSLRHWRMRSSFLDANLRIGSLGRIREVDEEFLSMSEKECSLSPRPLSRSGVRVIQVQPKENELLQGFVQEEDLVCSEVLNECTLKECEYGSNDSCDFSDEPEGKKGLGTKY